MSQKRSRGFTVTLFDYTEEHRQGILAVDCEYVIVGKEICPTTGRPHLQGFIYFSVQRTCKGVLRDLPAGVHLEPAKAAAIQNTDYCSKEGDYEERGVRPRQGKRNDLGEAVNVMLSRGMDAAVAEHPTQYARYFRGLQFVESVLRPPPPRNKKSHVFVVCGEHGINKTRTVIELSDGDYFMKPRGEWWQNYKQQKWVLIDDFTGWMHYDEILRLCDRYKMQVPIKGGYLEFNSDVIVITSNRHYSTWWPEEYIHGMGAFERRICCFDMDVKTKEEMAVVKAKWIAELARDPCSSE